jgi:hypothetical protein
VVDNAAEGAKLQARIKEINPACDAEMVLVGAGATLTDDATVEDYEALLSTLNSSADASSYEDSEYSEITTDSSTATPASGDDGVHRGAALPFKGVVFMAGLHDDSVIAEKAFSRCVSSSVCFCLCACFGSDGRPDTDPFPYTLTPKTASSSSRRHCSRARTSPRASGS